VSWRLVCRRKDIPRDRGRPIWVGETEIAVFDVNGDVFAVENVCRHLQHPIHEGALDRGCVTCPWHGWRYDLRTGAHLTMFGRRPGLRTFPVRTEGEDVLVDVE
jgi:nitrite reductase/ring-hydroxylating ferredoxin subunit